MSALKMVRCGWCDKQAFIPGDLPPLATEPCKNCGHQIMMPMQLRQFELRSKIASGGMGIVYRAWDMTLERQVAVKLMKKELLEDPTAMEAFYREALQSGDAPAALAKVQRASLDDLRRKVGLCEAVRKAGPFVLTY